MISGLFFLFLKLVNSTKVFWLLLLLLRGNKYRTSEHRNSRDRSIQTRHNETETRISLRMRQGKTKKQGKRMKVCSKVSFVSEEGGWFEIKSGI